MSPLHAQASLQLWWWHNRYLRSHFLASNDTAAMQCRDLRLSWEFLWQTALGSDAGRQAAVLPPDDSCLTAHNSVCEEAPLPSDDAAQGTAMECLPRTDSTDCNRRRVESRNDLPATTLTFWSTDHHTGACPTVLCHGRDADCGECAGLIGDLKHFFPAHVTPKLGHHVHIKWLDRR